MTHPNKSETVFSKQQTNARPVAMAEIQKSLERDVPNLSRRTSPRIADPALDSSKMAFMICTSCCTLSGDANWKITAFTAKREAKFAATVICAICWGSKVVPHQVSHTWFKHETQYIYILPVLSCIIWIFLFSSPKMSGHVGNNSPAKPPQRKGCFGRCLVEIAINTPVRIYFVVLRPSDMPGIKEHLKRGIPRCCGKTTQRTHQEDTLSSDHVQLWTNAR